MIHRIFFSCFFSRLVFHGDVHTLIKSVQSTTIAYYHHNVEADWPLMLKFISVLGVVDGEGGAGMYVGHLLVRTSQLRDMQTDADG